MTSNPLFYQLLLVTLVLICLLIHVWWPDASSTTPQTPLKPNKPQRTGVDLPDHRSLVLQRSDTRHVDTHQTRKAPPPSPTGRPEALAQANPCGCSVTPPALPVQATGGDGRGKKGASFSYAEYKALIFQRRKTMTAPFPLVCRRGRHALSAFWLVR